MLCPEESKMANVLAKQGAVAGAMNAIERFPHSDAISAVGCRILAGLMDDKGVVAACQQLNAMVQNLSVEKGMRGVEKTLQGISRALAMVGSLAMVEENLDAIKNSGGASAVISAIEILRSMKSSAEQRTCMKTALKTLGQIAQQDGLPDHSRSAALVLSIINDPETPVNVCAEALKTLASMAMGSEDASNALIAANAVEAVLGCLKRHAFEENVVTAAFGALAELTETEDGVVRLTQTGGVGVCMTWLDDNAETASPELIQNVLAPLSNLALVDENITSMMSGGILDTIANVLTQHCSNVDVPQPGVLNAAVALTGRLAIDEGNIRAVVNRGTLRRIIDTALSHRDYLNDGVCMEATLFLIESAAMVPDVIDQLKADRALEMIAAAIAHNPNNAELVLTGARAQVAISGSGAETIRANIAELFPLLDKLIQGGGAGVERDLENVLRSLSTLATLDGMVDGTVAGEISSSMVKVIEMLERAGISGPAKQKLLILATQTLGRLPAIEGAHLDTRAITRALMAMVRANPDDVLLMESALYCLNDLAVDAETAAVIVSEGGVAALQEVIESNQGGERLREVAVATLEKIRLCAKTNLAALTKGDDFGKLIGAHAGDKRLLATCLEDIADDPEGLQALLGVLGDENLANASGAQAMLARAIRQQCAAQGVELSVSTPGELKALLELLTADAKTAPQLAVQKETVKLLGVLSMDATKTMALSGGIEAVLNVMESSAHDPATIAQCVQLINKMSKMNDAAVIAKLVEAGAASRIAAVLKANPESLELASNAVELLQNLCSARGVEEVTSMPRACVSSPKSSTPSRRMLSYKRLADCCSRSSERCLRLMAVSRWLPPSLMRPYSTWALLVSWSA